MSNLYEGRCVMNKYKKLSNWFLSHYDDKRTMEEEDLVFQFLHLIGKEIPKDYYMGEYGATCQKCNHILHYGNDLCYETEESIGEYCDGCGQKQSKQRNKKLEV